MDGRLTVGGLIDDGDEPDIAASRGISAWTEPTFAVNPGWEGQRRANFRLMHRRKWRGLSITLRTMLSRAERQPAVEVSAAGAPVALASIAA
jgi:hypothetical protein